MNLMQKYEEAGTCRFFRKKMQKIACSIEKLNTFVKIKKQIWDYLAKSKANL